MPATPEPVVLVVDPDASCAGREVRTRLDAGERVAGFVGDRCDASEEFTASLFASSPVEDVTAEGA